MGFQFKKDDDGLRSSRSTDVVRRFLSANAEKNVKIKNVFV